MFSLTLENKTITSNVSKKKLLEIIMGRGCSSVVGAHAYTKKDCGHGSNGRAPA
jgi:hypothetical protein